MKDRIRKIVKKYGTRDPFELADAMGAITTAEEISGYTRGFYHYFKRNGIICVDSKLSDEMARMVCAHELGHYIFHRQENAVLLKNTTFFNTNKFELEANRFMANLLVDDGDIQELLGYDFCIAQIAAQLGVTKDLMELRMKDYCPY